MIPMSILGPFMATLFWIGGFKYSSAGRAAIFNQLSTVFIIVLAYFFLKEGFTRRKAIGMVTLMAVEMVQSREPMLVPQKARLLASDLV